MSDVVVEKKPLLTDAKKTELKKFIKTTLTSIVVFAIGFICSSIGIDEVKTERLQNAGAEAVEQENVQVLIDESKVVGREVAVEKIKEQLTVKTITTTVGSKVKDWFFGLFKSDKKEVKSDVTKPIEEAPVVADPIKTDTAQPVVQ